MATSLTVVAKEKSTYVVTLAFTNAAGTAVTPDSATWTLSTMGGTVINSRANVAISPLASTVTVVLSGLDLAMQTGEAGTARRLFTVQATYTSTEGAALPLKDEFELRVSNLAAVA
jgi:hypothetical protein